MTHDHPFLSGPLVSSTPPFSSSPHRIAAPLSLFWDLVLLQLPVPQVLILTFFFCFTLAVIRLFNTCVLMTPKSQTPTLISLNKLLADFSIGLLDSFTWISQRYLKSNISKTGLIVRNLGPLGYFRFYLMSSPSTWLPGPGSHLSPLTLSSSILPQIHSDFYHLTSSTLTKSHLITLSVSSGTLLQSILSTSATKMANLKMLFLERLGGSAC